MKESIHAIFHLRDTFIIAGTFSHDENFFHRLFEMWNPDLEGQSRATDRKRTKHPQVSSDVTNSAACTCVHTQNLMPAQQVGVGYGCGHLRVWLLYLHFLISASQNASVPCIVNKRMVNRSHLVCFVFKNTFA